MILKTQMYKNILCQKFIYCSYELLERTSNSKIHSYTFSYCFLLRMMLLTISFDIANYMPSTTMYFIYIIYIVKMNRILPISEHNNRFAHSEQIKSDLDFVNNLQYRKLFCYYMKKKPF